MANIYNRFGRRFQKSQEVAEAYAWDDMETLLNKQNTSLADHNILRPNHANIEQTRSLNAEDNLNRGREMYLQLNEDQRLTADQILCATQHPTQLGPCFFMDGPGGTGKIFLYESLYHTLVRKGKNVCTVAWTGIAANLLPNGKTVHSIFKLPVPLMENSTYNVRAGTVHYEKIKKIDVIIWDEAPMAPRRSLEAIDLLLRDIKGVDLPFGGTIIVLGGDYRQVLSVVKHGNRRSQIQASLKMSKLWSVIRLHVNVRTGPDNQQFSDWLLKLGNGTLPCNANGEIDISENNRSNGDLIKEVFEDKLKNPNDPGLQHRVILAPKNENVFQLNITILSEIPGEEKMYKSIDTVECDADEHITNYPTECLNNLTPTGFPPHALSLKKGAIIMLLRNLNIDEGLCNGTRLVVKQMRDHVLLCKVLTRSKSGHQTFIPKIDLISSDPFLPVRMRRPTVRLAYAMTIKYQGQTFDKVGLYLPEPVFSHGQLYVAFSRVRTQDSIRVKCGGKESCTKNIVFHEILE